tara:strand:- start:329 stop:1039 length:711 start_codon:yes stop_codon:yes gene_type:complete
MAKIDKSLYSKEEWHKIRQERRNEKRLKNLSNTHNIENLSSNDIAFVIGNGVSRLPIDLEKLKSIGKVYACNAVYRTFQPDFLVAVDVKMILEINKAGFQHKNQVWTNPNRSYERIKNLNFFSPSKGWSSGPTALWLATQHQYKKIYILGFDFRGSKQGRMFNNIYADTANYKKSTDGATFFGNWMRQTTSVIKQNTDIEYKRVIAPDNYCPEELNKFNNLENIFIEDFQQMFNLA